MHRHSWLQPLFNAAHLHMLSKTTSTYADVRLGPPRTGVCCPQAQLIGSKIVVQYLFYYPCSQVGADDVWQLSGNSDNTPRKVSNGGTGSPVDFFWPSSKVSACDNACHAHRQLCLLCLHTGRVSIPVPGELQCGKQQVSSPGH